MPDERFQYRRDQVAWRVLENEAVVLDLRTQALYFLNHTAAALWERLADGASEDELATALAHRSGLSPEEIVRDISDWLSQLVAAGLLERTAKALPTRPAAPPSSSAPQLRYVPPRLTQENIAFFAGVGCGKSAPTQMECAIALRDS